MRETLIETDAKVHATAVVDPGARLGRGVDIGPYCVVGENVKLGDGCRLYNQVTIVGDTEVGHGCTFFPGAVIGMPPQDLKYRGEHSRVVIGHDNTFREMVTVHPGTAGGGLVTRVGDHNHFLVGVHIAHDCTVGNHCIIANHVQFAGHVRIEDYVTFGGQIGVHHFVTVGKHAMIGGLTRITADVPPFLITVAARGTRSEVRMVNGVGLQRRGFTHERITALKAAHMRLYSRRARMGKRSIVQNIADLLAETPLDDNVEYLCRFLLRSMEHGRHGRYLESLRSDNKYHRRPSDDKAP